MKYDADTCGVTVRAARRGAELVLSQVAEAIGVSPTTLWRMEQHTADSKWTPELFFKAMNFINKSKP